MANWQNDINVDLSFVNIDSFYMNFKWFRKRKTKKVAFYMYFKWFRKTKTRKIVFTWILSDSGKENKKGVHCTVTVNLSE